jgi:hypothetical protein
MICSFVRLVPAAHVSRSLLVSLGITPALPTEPGLLPFPLIFLKANLSNIGLEPHEEDGDGRRWKLCIKIDLERGVWFPLGRWGRRIRRGYGELGLNNRFDVGDTNEDVLWWVIDDQITVDTCAPRGTRTCMNDATASMHVIQA